ncbi:MAG TPA: NADPH-dependent glutamate synthase [Spirochaetota bacterium]|nr:NADPH-dependent glutamate synthase [Spirochaetota bacterium]HOF13279.1 NADPH-dependent glutamate synthase [Spirochaetota bacterium]HOM86556.1 NADPH-dependent glutamate synthase [Spirochaetota bacterium]HOR92869.1 NADPH-dependent glutamate synthase [Spirochaetota bacterium]HOT19677.1 NADPH-dependent glutamate synthase [Spirochaetota bacterium]
MADKIPRQKMPQQDAKNRIRNFNEVPLGYDEKTAMVEAARCLQCKRPACVDGCPVNVNIPGFIKALKEGRPLEAFFTIKQTNSLPAVCGRVCPQEDQCEKLCVLAKKGDAVAIGNLERYVADYEREKEHFVAQKSDSHTNKKVAIIGSGPAGLTAAGDLARIGYDVTIFEALHKAGGVLVYGIPEFRLPKDIVQYEIDALKAAGVTIGLSRVIGTAETVNDLLSTGFDAVFVATGAGLPLFLDIPGENLQGVYSANEYLTRSNLMKAYKFPEYDTPIVKGQKVAVFGGGNVAMDSARTALRLGSKEVYIVYRRSRTEMPARVEEVERAEEEGVIFTLLTNPVQFIGDEKGRVKAVECLKMELGEPDASGRRSPIPVKGSEFTIAIDVAIIAIGNGPNPLIPKTTPGMNITKRGNIIADPETMKTSKIGVFAGGDIVTGAATVIQAMGAGRKAAKAIDEYLSTGAW